LQEEKMLTEKMEEALNAQVNAELYSSYLYLAMGAWLDTQKLPGFVHWMKTQALEEMYHGIKLFDYIRSAGGRARLEAIARPEGEWKSALDVAEGILAHERKVTGLIKNLVKVAQAEKDPATEQLLAWYIKEQVEEEESAEEVLTKVKKAGANLAAVDAELGDRTFKIPKDSTIKFRNVTFK
jgi:ferritin